MSKITLVEQSTAPDTPGTNQVVVYANTNGELCTKDDGGTVRVSPAYASSTWVPALSFGGAAVGVTYTSRYGLYCKVGDICFFQGAIVLSSKGSSTGAAVVSGLIYTARNTANAYVPITIDWINMTTSLVHASGTILLNTTTFALAGIGAAGVTVPGLADTDFANNTEIRFSGAYIV